MLVLEPALGGVAVVMRAAFTMLMMVLVSGRMICCIHSSICKSGNKAQYVMKFHLISDKFWVKILKFYLGNQ